METLNQTIITLTDKKLSNQISMMLFIQGFVYQENKYENLYVLAPSRQLLETTEIWLKTNNIKLILYDFPLTDDPYHIKLMLAKFINEYDVKNTHHITYLDPDHFVFSKFQIPLPDYGNLWVGSEGVESTYPFLPHLNTSLISGMKGDWLRVLNKWEDIYCTLENVVSTRYREEISFCESARASNIKLHRISSKIQGCFKEYYSSCSLLHYGGESQQTKILKSCISAQVSNDEIITELRLSSNIFPKELLEKIIEHMEEIDGKHGIGN